MTGSGGSDPGGPPRGIRPDADDLDDWEELGRYKDPLAAQREIDAEARLTAWVSGRVQGVGFRWWVRRNALELGLLGTAENLVDGRVKVVAEGGRDSLAELLGRLEGPGAPGQVAQVTHRWDPVRGGFSDFVER
jgi:acylphosphatase